MILSINVSAISLDKRRKKIISIINEELSEVQRLSSQVRGRNPDHLLRMAELNLEKARLWREKENQSYIALPNKTRRIKNKRKYFEISRKFFLKANQLCLKIARNFKRYHSIGDVYYILGYNAKESGKNKTALKYFSKALKKTKRKSVTRIKAQISQAELYYNQKDYKKAIPLYEKSLSSFSDKWWTKDSFNLAWCYFRSRKYSQAINKMKDVFSKSSNKKYIDMRSSVERDIGLFFATAGKIEEGIQFYKKIGINFTDQLLRIAVTMKSKGQYSLANKTLQYALRYEKNSIKKHEIYIEQLVLYAAFGKRQSHLRVSRILFKAFLSGSLSSNKQKVLTFQAGKQGAILQKQVVSKTYRRLNKQRKRKAYMAIEYFGMLAELEPQKSAEYYFLQGETAFSLSSYTKALVFYNKSFDTSIKSRSKKFKNRSMDGLLSSLGKKSVKRTVKDSYYIPTYSKYLKFFPKGKRRLSVFQKLFKVHLDQNDYKSSKAILDEFKTSYPRNWKIQEAMIAELMEIDRKKKRNDRIRDWIKSIDARVYFVSQKYAKKLKELLTSIQIDDVQADLKKGNKRKALVGYHKILKDRNSTKRSRINAKYNLAALYYEIGAAERSLRWSNESLSEMSSVEAQKFSDSFLTISTFLFTQLEFEKSAELATGLFNKLCRLKSRKKQIAFKNATLMYLANGNTASVESLLSRASTCRISESTVSSARFELMSDYLKVKNWRGYEKHFNNLSKKRSNWPKLILPARELATMHSNLGNKKLSLNYFRKKRKYFNYADKSSLDIPVAALDDYAYGKIRVLENIKSKMLDLKLSFPEKFFQKSIKRKFVELDRLVAQASSIQKIGSGNGIVKAYSILISAHYQFAEQVRAFIPSGMKKSFIPLFKKDMNDQIIKPLLKQAENYEADAVSAITKNEILSPYNFEIERRLGGKAVRFWYPPKVILMDRGGK